MPDLLRVQLTAGQVALVVAVLAFLGTLLAARMSARSNDRRLRAETAKWRQELRNESLRLERSLADSERERERERRQDAFERERLRRELYSPELTRAHAQFLRTSRSLRQILFYRHMRVPGTAEPRGDVDQLMDEMEEAAIALEMHASPETFRLAVQLKNVIWEAVRLSREVTPALAEMRELDEKKRRDSSSDDLEQGAEDLLRSVKLRDFVDERLPVIHKVIMSTASELEKQYISAARKDLDIES